MIGFVSALAALAACERVEPVTVGIATATKRMSTGDALDILFVIDNSASTADKQALFARNLPTLAAALDGFPGGRPSLHLGVVSSSVSIGNANFGANCATGDDGALQATPRVTLVDGTPCAPPSGSFILDVANADGTRTTNYTGTLADTLACIGQLGPSGCGFEAHLEALKRALDGSRAENAGFLRPDAALAVIVLADEDDCSVADPALFDLASSQAGPGDFRCQPLYSYSCDAPISATDPGTYSGCKPKRGGYLRDVDAYRAFLSSIKDPSQTAVAVIAGDVVDPIATGAITIPFDQPLALMPSCTATIDGNFAIARPALRLAELAASFGDHGSFQSVCQSDYSGALVAIGRTLFSMMGPCLEGNIALGDRDPANPGLQPACTVTERAPFGAVGEQDAVVPACAMRDAQTPDPAGARPCWWVDAAPACTATPSGLALHVERATPVPANGVVDATCELAN
jgi:hypothetical protein